MQTSTYAQHLHSRSRRRRRIIIMMTCIVVDNGESAALCSLVTHDPDACSFVRIPLALLSKTCIGAAAVRGERASADTCSLMMNHCS